MDRNVIKRYISMLDKNMIEKFALKQKIELTSHELDVIYKGIKEDFDNFLDSDFYKQIANYKNDLSDKVYNKIIELYEKYKNYIK